VAKGTVSKKQRANGLTWIYRYQTTRPSDGKQVENTRVVGLVKDIGNSEAAAWREIGKLGLDINVSSCAPRQYSFRELAQHFRQYELKKASGLSARAVETVDTNERLLDNWIIPRWGDTPWHEVRFLMIESWFESIAKPHGPLEWPSIVKIRSVMSQVFKHAQRHELIPAAIGPDGRLTNPVLLARCKAT